MATVIVLWSAFPAPLDRREVTSALVVTVAGLVLGSAVLDVLHIVSESSVAGHLTEVALVLLLFSDAARLDLPTLRRELA